MSSAGMSLHIFLLLLPAAGGALLGWHLRIWSLVPAVLLSIAGALLLARLSELTTINTVFASASSALACQCGYIVSSLAKSHLYTRTQARKPAADTAKVDSRR